VFTAAISDETPDSKAAALVKDILYAKGAATKLK
jgi:hypothetical protein